MEEQPAIIQQIVARVRSFCDDIVAGRVSEDLLKKHKIPREYLDICRDASHPSSKKLKNRLFEHLMLKTGTYYNLNNEAALNEIYVQIDELLMNPKEDTKERPLYMPRFIYGVKHALDSIERLNQAKTIDFAEKAKVENMQFGKVERSFQLTYSKDPRVSVSLEDYAAPANQVQIDGQDMDVPEGGAHVGNYQRHFTQPDEVEIEFDRFHHSCLKDDKTYYFRYVTEVNTKYDLQRSFEISGFDVEGLDVFAIDTLVDGYQLLLYFAGYKEKRYLIIEYQVKMTAKEMSDLCFSTLVAFGMLTADVHLNECWLAAYEDADKKTELGLYFQSLVPSIHCDYQIFTTNVYPSLVHIAKKIDPNGGEHRACDIISHLKLSNALLEFPSEVFGRLVGNMRKYEELQRGIFIILMGSKLHLEIQAATYCVALEAISNLAPKIISQKEEHIINDKKAWKEVKKRFDVLTEELCKQQIISAGEKKSVKTKIENMNKAFNSEKLRALLVYYHYPLRQFDELTLMLRNLLLHGNIKFKVLKGRTPEDYLFELSMNLHKLCCAIALLMSGYKGYIVNNRKLYGFAGSYKAFIRIGDNVRVEYPKYKEKEGHWKKVVRCGVCVWEFCWYLFVPRWGRGRKATK